MTRIAASFVPVLLALGSAAAALLAATSPALAISASLPFVA